MIAGGGFDSSEELRVSGISIKGITALNTTELLQSLTFLHSWKTSLLPLRTLHPPECLMISSSPASVKCQYMPITSSVSDLLLVLHCLTQKHTFLCVYTCKRNFQSFILHVCQMLKGRTELPALSTVRCITASVISPHCRGTRMQPRDQ